MPRTWTKTEAFAHFGAELENVRWSWSGVSPDGGVVVLVLWQDGIKGRNGELTYADEDDLEAEWRSRPGHHARTRHLKHSVDQLDGRFRAVIARAVDTDEDPRRIASCHPQEKAIWQIDRFDEKTGTFAAHVVRGS